MASKTRILIVEDETAVAMMLVSLLTSAGFNADSAWNAEKTLQRVEEANFDLITLDIDLPGMNGFEICNRLKQNPRSRNIPIIFVSGRSHTEDRRHAFELGAVDYIQKPFELTDFIFRISSHTKGTVPISEGAPHE